MGKLKSLVGIDILLLFLDECNNMISHIHETGVAFVNFGDTSCTSENVVFLTNANSEDFMHPIYVSALEFDNSPENTMLYYHRPSLG